jgi:hypothetical protein
LPQRGQRQASPVRNGDSGEYGASVMMFGDDRSSAVIAQSEAALRHPLIEAGVAGRAGAAVTESKGWSSIPERTAMV